MRSNQTFGIEVWCQTLTNRIEGAVRGANHLAQWNRDWMPKIKKRPDSRRGAEAAK